MSKAAIKIQIDISCPYCNNQDVDFLYASEMSISNSGVDITAIDGYCDEITNDNDLYCHFLIGVCNNCHKIIKMGFDSPNKQMIDFDIKAELTLEFNDGGIPIALTMNEHRIIFEKVLYEPRITQSLGKYSNYLTFLPPIGSYTINSIRGRFMLYIDFAEDFIEQDGRMDMITKKDRLYFRITNSDQRFYKYMEMLIPKKDSTGVIRHMVPEQKLPYQNILVAAYLHLFRVETLIRNKIWLLLKEEYEDVSPNWWKGSIPKEIVDYLKESAKKSNDADFIKCPPSDYLTLGQCKELIDKKWEQVFRKSFSNHDQLILLIKELEEKRNAIAHFRVFSIQEYNDLTNLCTKLEETFM